MCSQRGLFVVYRLLKTMLKLVSQEVGLTRLGGLLAEAAVSSLD